MPAKLYVGHLSFRVTQAQLEELFSQVGDVIEAFLVSDRYTGKSKGFAFLHMGTEAAAQEAVARFHGFLFDELPMTVHLLIESETPIKKYQPSS
jgi:RNA recognition motif-containing protein